ALALGVLGSGLGVPLGYLLARAALGPIRSVLGDVIELGETTIDYGDTALALFAFAAGVLATVTASLMPALEASREEPADAVRRVPLVPSVGRRLMKVGVVAVLLLAC